MGLMATIGRAMTRRSIENPSVPLSSGADWLYDIFGATRSGSGIRVSRETALTCAAFWKGCNLISSDVARVPCRVYKQQDGVWKLRDPEHATYGLLRHQSNAEMTAFIFKKVVQFHATAVGNGYAYIKRTPIGEPEELIPLLPHWTYPMRVAGKLRYVTEVDGEEHYLLPENVLHIKGLSYDGLAGYSLIAKARESLGLAIGAERFGSVFFRNNATPSLVLQHPGTLGDQALKRLRESWSASQGGIENAHKPKVLEEGMTVHQMSINAKDAQLIEIRRHQIKEVANFLGVPPHKLGDDTRNAYNSLEQENQSYLDETLEAWFVNWEQECRAKLLTEKEKRKSSRSVRFDRKQLVQMSADTQSKYFPALVNGGLMLPDEARYELGLNPLPDDEGQKLRLPTTVVIVGEEEETTEPEGEETSPSGDNDEPLESDQSPEPPDVGQRDIQQALLRTQREWVLEVAQRMAKRLSTEAKRASSDDEKFMDWLNEDLVQKHAPVVVDAFNTVAELCGTKSRDVSGMLLERFRKGLEGVYDTAKKAEFPARIAEFCAEFEQKQPETLANCVISRSELFEEKSHAV